MSFEEKKKYGSMEKAFQAGLKKANVDKIIETSDFTVARITKKTHNGNPVYYDGMNYWEVDKKGFINEVTLDVTFEV